VSLVIQSIQPFYENDNRGIIPNLFDMTRHCLDITDMVGRQLFSEIVAPHSLSLSGDIHLSLVDLLNLKQMLEEGDCRITSLLSAAELQLYSKFSYAKRRLEWLGGRLAAKDALTCLLGDPSVFRCRDLSVLPDSHGRPVVSASVPLPWKPGLSLSHSTDYAVALACREGLCGVDIQFCSERLQSVRERFTTDVEMALFAENVPELPRLAVLWTAKEAVKKCFFADQPTFFGRMQVRCIREPDAGGWEVECQLNHGECPRIPVIVTQLEKHFLAWVTGGAHA
jgi:phosphopantetheinyl transferase (holo-ACP synthase)